MTYYALPPDPPVPLWRRGTALGALAGLHVVALLLAFGVASHPELAQPVQILTVRMLEIEPPAKVEPPRPKPIAVPPRPVSVAPPPVMAASTAAPVSSFALAPLPASHPPESVVAPVAAAPAPVFAARFDADYLQNPKPMYPPMSRRLGEEGKVVLRVRVSAQGASLGVEVKQSSGFPRLDEAARAAVEKWRFVPARQGGEAIESSVLVPLHFTLDS